MKDTLNFTSLSPNQQHKQAQVLVQSVAESLKRGREEREQQIPKIPLRAENVENTSLLLNREILLKKFGKGGNVAEIGVDEGKFSQKIFEINTPDHFHLVDIWGTDRFHDGKYQNVKNFFNDQIESDQVHIHKNLSTDAAYDFPDNYFDWIYIDTDHTYETTRDELRLYAPKMKKGGIIAGHDYVHGNWIATFRYGVVEAVHEFCVQFGWEIIYLTIEPTENQSFAIRKI